MSIVESIASGLASGVTSPFKVLNTVVDYAFRGHERREEAVQAEWERKYKATAQQHLISMESSEAELRDSKNKLDQLLEKMAGSREVDSAAIDECNAQLDKLSLGLRNHIRDASDVISFLKTTGVCDDAQVKGVVDDVMTSYTAYTKSYNDACRKLAIEHDNLLKSHHKRSETYYKELSLSRSSRLSIGKV